jgi:hypothetical protein
MKNITNLIFTLILTLVSVSVFAQVRVTGHVSAEVVESVSAHNAFNQNISLNNNNKSIELGSIVVEGPRNSAYDVSIQNAAIYNESGVYTLSTGLGESMANNSSTQSLSLSALLEQEVPNGDYDGKLTVIVSYN